MPDANLAHHRPHVPGDLALARAAVGAATRTDPSRWHLMRQVHGVDVGVVTTATPPGAELRGVDALVSVEPGRTLVVLTADCLPVLVAGRKGAAAIHAGWRGLVADVVSEAVAVLVRLGERRDDLRVAVGPSIGPCCYEVGEEVAVQLSELGRDVVRRGPDGRPRADLRAALRARLGAAGLGVELDESPCTRCGPGRWFSHRGDPAAGRQAGLVTVPGS